MVIFVARVNACRRPVYKDKKYEVSKVLKHTTLLNQKFCPRNHKKTVNDELTKNRIFLPCCGCFRNSAQQKHIKAKFKIPNSVSLKMHLNKITYRKLTSGKLV